MQLSRRLAALGTIFLLGASFPLDAVPPIISSIEIVTDGPIEEIRKVITLKEGDTYDPVRVENVISALKKWGRFREVGVEKDTGGGGVRLRFVLHDGYLISGIDILGTYPYLSARVRRMITVHSGDPYDAQAAQEQTEKIVAFYERQGIAGTKVQFSPRINEAKKTVDLKYSVDKGDRYRIGTIKVSGSTAASRGTALATARDGSLVFPRGYFISKINPLLSYTQARLRRSLEKIRKDYLDKGYLGSRVRLVDLGRDEASKTVNPIIEIKEGKHVTVLFEGNQRVSRRTMKQILPLYTEGGYGAYEVEASSKAISDRYHRLGFQEVQVATEVAKPSADEREMRIRFIVREGPQTRVKTIDIEGNREIGDRKIKRELLTKENSITERGYYQPRTVDLDFERLPLIMRNRGALEAEALDHETTLNAFRDKAHVSFTVREGEITHIRAIRFEGNDHFPDGKLRGQIGLSQGDPVSFQTIGQDQEDLSVFYANNGFPYATVKGDLEREGSQATLVYRISEGVPVTIGEVLVVGNERTEKKAVLRVMRIRPGNAFSFKKVLDSEAQLRSSGAFRSVNIQTIGLTEKDAVVHLVVKLEEYRKIVVDIGATYDTDHSFTGDLSISHVNLGGTIRRANLRLTGGRDIQKGEFLFKDPFFLGYPFEASLSFVLERDLRPGFKTVEGGGSINFLREFTPRISLLGRYQVMRTFFTDVVDSSGIAEEDHTTSKFSFSFNYDHRDSYSDPRRGFLAFAGIDFSNKLIASTFNFVQPKGYFAYYLPLGSRITFLVFARMEGIKVFGGDQLTRDQKLFLGGDYTVRGFSEDSIGPVGADGRPAGGQLLLAATSELQTKLFQNFKLAAFFDNGSITDDFGGVGSTSFRHSAGLGLRYVTPVGPLRLDYGFKLDRRPGESIGRLHFAFGYAF